MKSLMKVYYGWAKLGKVRKKEAISVIYENNVGVGEHHRMSKALKASQNTVYCRYQTDKEAEDAKLSNRIFTEFSVFMDDKRIAGSLERALQANSDADKENVSSAERKKIAELLRRAFLAEHRNYKEPLGLQLELFNTLEP